jgi:tripartite-type tricarboxylate transporter receptor subunit TctC
MPSLPDVPTIAETVPGFVVVTWFAIVAPPKTPAPIVAKLNADINEALRDATVSQRLGNLTAEVVGGTLAENAAFFKSETARWTKVIEDANVKLEN